MQDRQSAALNNWARRIEARHADLDQWSRDPAGLWSTLSGFAIGPAAQRFVQAVAGHAVDDPDGFATNPAVHRLILERELGLKGTRARLSHRAALENWQGEPFGGQFEFRWTIAKSHLADLAAAHNRDRR